MLFVNQGDKVINRKLVLLISVFIFLFFLFFQSMKASANESIMLLERTNLYEEPSFDSVQNGSLSPQVVNVINKQKNWLQIQSYLGPRWIHPIYYQQNDKTYYLLTNNMPLYETKFSSHPISFISPQRVIVKEKDGNWLKIQGDTGDRWVNLDTSKRSYLYKIQLLEITPFYEDKDTNSRRINAIAPQNVKVVKKEGDYFLVKTWLGDYWIKPTKYINENGETKLLLDKTYSVYNSNSIDTKTNSSVSPQAVTLIEETTDWWQVKTGLGEKFLYKKEGKKIAYLTFDDGPNQYTDDLLKILKDHNVKATFFMLEPNMRYHPNLVKQMKDEGHFTALHSVTHDRYKLYSSNPYNPVWEMEKGRKTLKNITGQDHYLVRMPYGSVPFMNASFRNALVEYDYKMWDWTIDSNDWRYNASSYWTIVSNVKYQLANVEKRGEPVVILMHDRIQTVKALPHIIELLHAKGYQLNAYNPDTHVTVNFWDDSRL